VFPCLDGVNLPQTSHRDNLRHAGGWEQGTAAVEVSEDTLLVPKFTWVPFPFSCGHLPFHLLERLLQVVDGLLQVVEVEEGEVEEGGYPVGGWGELWGYAVVAVGLSGKLLLQLGEAGFVKKLWGNLSRINEGVCWNNYEHTALHFLPFSIQSSLRILSVTMFTLTLQSTANFQWV